MFNSFFFITYQALIRLLCLYHKDSSLLVLELTKKCECIIFDTSQKILFVICFNNAYWDSISMIQKPSVLLNTSIR